MYKYRHIFYVNYKRTTNPQISWKIRIFVFFQYFYDIVKLWDTSFPVVVHVPT